MMCESRFRINPKVSYKEWLIGQEMRDRKKEENEDRKFFSKVEYAN